jgi:prepilin-type N-terminal cleavage/methylation domain-containing protein
MLFRRKAFTLIELLIVVAIIAILAAIAVPNFLEAQTRSKVSRVHADLRSLAIAFETYYSDHNMYPIHRNSTATTPPVFMDLTTPIAYISIDPRDPFLQNSFKWSSFWSSDYHWGVLIPHPSDWLPGRSGYPANYWCSNWACVAGSEGERLWIEESARGRKYALNSAGPDRELGDDYFAHLFYDPTNGTRSGGNIFRIGP